MTASTLLLGGDELCAAPGEGFEDDLALERVPADRTSEDFEGLLRVVAHAHGGLKGRRATNRQVPHVALVRHPFDLLHVPQRVLASLVIDLLDSAGLPSLVEVQVIFRTLTLEPSSADRAMLLGRLVTKRGDPVPDRLP